MNVQTRKPFFDFSNGCGQGWLWSKVTNESRTGLGIFQSKWLKRWVVIKDNAIHTFYKNKDLSKLENKESFIALKGFEIRFVSESRRKLSFSISNGHVTYQFAALKEDDWWKWMNVIRYQVDDKQTSKDKINDAVETNETANNISLSSTKSSESTSSEENTSNFDSEDDSEVFDEDEFGFKICPTNTDKKPRASSLPDIRQNYLQRFELGYDSDASNTLSSTTNHPTSHRLHLSENKFDLNSKSSIEKNLLYFRSRSLDSLLEQKFKQEFRNIHPHFQTVSKISTKNSFDKKGLKEIDSETRRRSLTRSDCLDPFPSTSQYNDDMQVKLLRRRMTMLSSDNSLNEKLLQKRALQRQLKEKTIELEYVDKLLKNEKITKPILVEWINEHSSFVLQLKSELETYSQRQLADEEKESCLPSSETKEHNNFLKPLNEQVKAYEQKASTSGLETNELNSVVNAKTKFKKSESQKFRLFDPIRKLSSSKNKVVRTLSDTSFHLPHSLSKSSFSFQVPHQKR